MWIPLGAGASDVLCYKLKRSALQPAINRASKPTSKIFLILLARLFSFERGPLRPNPLHWIGLRS
jgi:hypothetical protein